MKAFLQKILLFIICLYSVIVCVILLTNYQIKKHANFKLKSNINKIIIGNSQPECAYNDSLINNFKNLASSGETYFYNYQKLKPLLEQNPQIDTVFIEFSNANILIREDQKIWSNKYITHQLPKYFPFVSLKDQSVLATNNPIGYQKALLMSLKTNLNRLWKNNYSYKDSIGGYWYLKRHKINAILDTLKLSKTNEITLNKKQLSTVDLEYLHKIIALCKEHHIVPYLIRSPFHPYFNGSRYETDYQQILNSQFKSIPFIDFKSYPLKSEEYADLQHLNFKGSLKYSNWFNDYINLLSTH